MRTIYTYDCESYLIIDKPKIVNVGACEIRLEGGGKENTICRLVLTVPGGHADNEVLAHEISSFVANYLTAMHNDARFLILREAERVEILDCSDGRSTARTVSGSVGAFTSGIGPLNETVLKPEVIHRFYNEFREPLSAYLEGLDARSELDKFRNFYRVIEWKFDPKAKQDRRRAKDRLKNSGLPEYLLKPDTQSNTDQYLRLLGLTPEDFIDQMVDLRDQCSHLRDKRVNDFGYSTQDLQQLREIRRWLPSKQGLARSIIFEATMKPIETDLDLPPVMSDDDTGASLVENLLARYREIADLDVVRNALEREGHSGAIITQVIKAHPKKRRREKAEIG